MLDPAKLADRMTNKPPEPENEVDLGVSSNDAVVPSSKTSAPPSEQGDDDTRTARAFSPAHPSEEREVPTAMSIPTPPGLVVGSSHRVAPEKITSPSITDQVTPSKKEKNSQVPTTPVTPAPAVPPVPPARTKKRKVADLKCCEARWCYRKPDSEKWIPFNGRDSLFLEIKYRLRNSVPLDEAAQTIVDENHLEARDMVDVLDGLYKLVVPAEGGTMRIEAIYWKDDQCDVRRGTWFFQDLQPLESTIADSIDRHHLQYFRGQIVPDGTTVFSTKEGASKPQLTELHLDNMEVRWSSVIDIYFSVKRAQFLRYIGWGKTQLLRRGFEKEAEWADATPEISHLILVVHGIGQKGYENLIAQNAQQVREGVIAAMEKHFPEEKSRPMFLPVEWRSSLILDDGVTDHLTLPKMSAMRNALNSTAMDIMYYQSPLYRKEIVAGVVSQLNCVYTQFKENNPTFNGPVSIFAHSLGSVLAYDVLTTWSPVLMYDKYVIEAIDEQLTTCPDEETASTLKAFQEARETLYNKFSGGMRDVLISKQEQLVFKVKFMFAVGSPLGVFLVMRGAKAVDLLPKKAHVERIFNLFHPYDPVAYRLEPMFAPEWKSIRPVKIFSSHDLRGRSSYDALPLEVHKSYLKKKEKREQKANKKNGIAGKTLSDAKSGGDEELMDEEDECDSDDMRSGCSSPRSMTPPPVNDEKEKPAVKKSWFSFGASSTDKDKRKATSTDTQVEVAKEAESELPLADRILGSASRVPHRMDFALQPAITDKSYWSVLKSHFAYWTNPDMGLFVANALYGKGPGKEAAEVSKQNV